MNSWPIDIRNRIAQCFPEKSDIVVTKLDKIPPNLRDRPRIARCILQLANGDFEKLDNLLIAACSDYRDVIWWAEYDHPLNPDTRLRNLGNPFETI
ncbi:hypothetical protein [Adhaeretor mobilis]|uniref:Uncharacterized protein n=1 Tax=Adhaeretor mobilis TaxID=1930276 RepID=A0A517MU83_9BACT|nr:hypothetical protein [Adhaeretor mobilis]QDS98443.1 hypothetical protein HG15A2_17210 [Adhaeretor mobilis]